MDKISEHLHCESCDGITETKFITKTFKRNGQGFTFHNVKAEVCPKCGARYFDGQTLTEVEEDIKNRIIRQDEQP